MPVSDLPELHGWLPARVIGRRLGVSPGTVRARARKGLMDVVPNPLGGGGLYREKPPIRPTPQGGGVQARTTAENSHRGQIQGLGRDDGIVFSLLPSSASRIAQELGLAPGTVDRSLKRLERHGFARRGAPQPSGPHGGRPEVVWDPVRP